MKTLSAAFVMVLALLAPPISAQTDVGTPDRPALVVGIVVDQMRWDFLHRYSDKYGTNGFKRLLREGLSCENTHINYTPSFTACGHTCVYSGSVPAVHGITGNDWYDQKEKKVVYCTEDTDEKTVGSDSTSGKMSPRRLLTTTVTDELRLASNFKSKVIGIALKDRGSILPAGHSANAAYFYDPTNGVWVTSSYYMKDLPDWVKQFNGQKRPEAYLATNWNTLLPIEDYSQSDEDDASYEATLDNETKPVFPHKVGALTKPSTKILASTPYGNSFTLEFAQMAVVNEHLGSNSVPDFLAVSLSSTDYIGHKFGPNSVEIEDCYLRLDRDLAQFFSFLDAQVGQGKYLVFLTADHGVAHVPGFAQRHKIPSGVFPATDTVKQLKRLLQFQYGEEDWILAYANMQFSFNNKLLAEKKIDRNDFKKTIRRFLAPLPGVSRVVDLENLDTEVLEAGAKSAINNGFFPARSGEMAVIYEPGWIEDSTKGTTHGTFYRYDTHIPLVWMGWKINHGEDYSEVHMTDIAPTVAALLHIQEPNGCVGKVIEGVLQGANAPGSIENLKQQ